MKNLIVKIILISAFLNVLGIFNNDNNVSAHMSCRSYNITGGLKITCDGINHDWVDEYTSTTRWEGTNGLSYAGVYRYDVLLIIEI